MSVFDRNETRLGQPTETARSSSKSGAGSGPVFGSGTWAIPPAVGQFWRIDERGRMRELEAIYLDLLRCLDVPGA